MVSNDQSDSLYVSWAYTRSLAAGGTDSVFTFSAGFLA
jgi:hypothetical protein